MYQRLKAFESVGEAALWYGDIIGAANRNYEHTVNIDDARVNPREEHIATRLGYSVGLAEFPACITPVPALTATRFRTLMDVVSTRGGFTPGSY